MKYWLRGKPAGLIVFLVIAGLFGGGLGWVTREVLQLEKEQFALRADADIRHALWLLDSKAFTKLATEADPNYSQCTLVRVLPAEKKGNDDAALELFELVSLEKSELPPWVERHYLVTRRSDWKPPEALQSYWLRSFGVKTKTETAAGESDERRQFLAGLVQDADLRKMFAQGREPFSPPSFPLDAGYIAAPQSNQAANSFPNNDNIPQQSANRDTSLRFGRAQLEQSQSPLANASRAQDPRIVGGPNQPVIFLGPPVRQWMRVGEEQCLVLTRLLQVGEKPACQVALLNWPELEKLLAEEVRMLLPSMRLLPVVNAESLNPDRAMATLPVELDPGPTESTLRGIGWNPLRIGLALAWTAAVIALLAVGLGGWSLINLSERRIRFVSAVTHELRTPLTTLRLYLDMLAGGMVADEVQKTEYIRTLHSEADRLNRLVSNVLDFSRLENQRPRLNQSAIPIGELLDQLQGNWQSHAKNCGKELVVEIRLDPTSKLVTDVQLVTQILGNLIDNACKYSQGAADSRIWIRARRETNHALLLEVEDRGPGVLPRDKRSIFRPFRRGRHHNIPSGGVGLGLALANRWTQLLGGKLSCNSPVDQAGACFRLELPG